MAAPTLVAPRCGRPVRLRLRLRLRLRRRLRRLARIALALAMLPLAACQTAYRLPETDVVLPTAALPAAQPAATAAAQAPNGAIFRADAYRPLFENHRARIVGDTLLVQIEEKLSAVQSSTSAVDRSGTVSAGISALPFLKSSALTRASAAADGANTFAGTGSTKNSNDFSGSVTVSVVQVLPNGHLVVAGEKQIGVNTNVDVLRFSGQVDPRAIAPGNTVQSTQVANVRIEQRGRGQAADAQAMGWLGRVFLNLLPM